jgi:hypothetical protein
MTPTVVLEGARNATMVCPAYFDFALRLHPRRVRRERGDGDHRQTNDGRYNRVECGLSRSGGDHRSDDGCVGNALRRE